MIACILNICIHTAHATVVVKHFTLMNDERVRHAPGDYGVMVCTTGLQCTVASPILRGRPCVVFVRLLRPLQHRAARRACGQCYKGEVVWYELDTLAYGLPLPVCKCDLYMGID